ncbi:RNA polymerase factor sigma-54 [Kiritimatiellota bacterium B12222]|nr:RNA polymerase factor sigma-54 [Kiritimatiellota bacterium B12222]
MDAYLHQNQSQRQQQVLAPQMRQSLEILQAPLQDLQQLIARELELNPTLEILEPDHERVEIESESSQELDDVSEREFDEEYEVLARLDDASRESFENNEIIHRPSADADAKHQFQMESITAQPTLQQHLNEQLTLSSLTKEEQQIGEMLIGSLDDDGFLSLSIEELSESIGVDLEVIEDVLDEIQSFDPVGVASRSLEECLMQQLSRTGKRGTIEARIVEGHLPELARHRYAELAKTLSCSEEDIREAASHIAMLDPRPGRHFSNSDAVYVIPEVFVKKINGRWRVRTNDKELPRLRISKHYREMMENPETSKEARRYIRDKVRGGSFLMKSMGQRQDTLKKIAVEVIKHQEAFLEEGVSQLKPLTMSDIAEIIGMHETTVSRAVNNKYVQTPRGTYELKYFFTPGYSSAGGGESVSNKSIKEAIRQLVDNENTAKPLSDQAIVKALAEQGFKVARRTITKYRDELHILPSHLRRQ